MHVPTSSRFGIGFLIVVSFFVLSATNADSQPVIRFEEKTHDWGRVLEGDDVKHVFRFQNVGDETLKIEKVKTS